MVKPLFLTGSSLWIELVYSAIIIIVSLFIYLRTKELYELTSYKGIKYFRNAFLFFGLAFFSRLLLRIITIVSDDPIGRGFHKFGFFIFLYAGLMAGFLLIYSIVWKQFKNSEQYESFLHPIALALAGIIVTQFFRPNFLLILAIVFLFAALLAYYYNKKTSKKDGFAPLYIIYILLFMAWISNVAAHFFIRISLMTAVVLYVISSILFLTIVYKVVKSTAGKK